MVQLRTFTKNDYYSYAGAGKLPDGSEPRIAEVDAFTIIVGGQEDGTIMVEVDYLPDNEELQDYKATTFVSTKIAIMFAEMLIADLEIDNDLKKLSEKYDLI